MSQVLLTYANKKQPKLMGIKMLLLDTGQNDSLQLEQNYIYSTYINFNLKNLPELLSSFTIKFYQLIFLNPLQ